MGLSAPVFCIRLKSTPLSIITAAIRLTLSLVNYQQYRQGVTIIYPKMTINFMGSVLFLATTKAHVCAELPQVSLGSDFDSRHPFMRKGTYITEYLLL